MALRLLMCFAAVSVVCGYQSFQQDIPNGNQVPNPCKSGIWAGVGHINVAGSGDRNIFGKAFHDAGKTWTKALCEADTDGDGKSNGEELGDPDCEWTRGATPKRTTGITHPAICDDINSDTCKEKNDWADGCPTSAGFVVTFSFVLVALSMLVSLLI